MTDDLLTEWRGRSVLFVLRSFAIGGSQRQVGLLAAWMQRNLQVDVQVWALERGGEFSQWLTREGVAWREKEGVVERHGVGKIPVLLGLIRDIRRLHPDVILTFNDFPNKVLGAVWEWTGAKLCVWNQRDEGREVSRSFLERRAVRRVPLFIANASEGKEFLQTVFSVPAERIVIVPNGVRLAPASYDRSTWRRKWGIGDDALVAVMVANLHRYKDHETLLRAWALVTAAPDAADARLVLAGQAGDTHEALRRLCSELHVEERVNFLGCIDDIPGVLAASDIGVFSSFREGMPNGVLECMAAGLPLAATAIDGIRRGLGDDYPFLVPPRDERALADALLALIRDRTLRIQWGNRNRRRVDDEFSVDAMGRRYVAAIEPFLSA